MLEKIPLVNHKNITWHKVQHNLFKILWVLRESRARLGPPQPRACSHQVILLQQPLPHGQEKRWHSSTTGTAVPRARDATGTRTHREASRVGRSCRVRWLRTWKITLELTPGTLPLPLPKPTILNFPNKLKPFDSVLLCWKCSKAINCCRFLQSCTFH